MTIFLENVLNIFYNLEIILSISDNFKNEIINSVKKKYYEKDIQRNGILFQYAN